METYIDLWVEKVAINTYSSPHERSIKKLRRELNDRIERYEHALRWGQLSASICEREITEIRKRLAELDNQ